MASNDIPIEGKYSHKLGRYLIAKRDIKKGELILKEDPIILYPIFDKNDHDKISCICCCQKVEQNKILECETCLWPVCSKKCPKYAYHKALECNVFKANFVWWSRNRAGLLYLVRALILRDQDPKKYNKIMLLDCNYSLNDGDEAKNLEVERAKGLLKKCKFKFSTKEIQRLVTIFAINSFGFHESEWLNIDFQGDQFHGALYAKSSLFAHSCAPNVEFLSVDRWSIGLNSIVDIKEGEVLSISYCEQYNHLGTKERRIALCTARSFICECSRCNDPTELGTHYSSLKCKKCKKGWLAPAISQVHKGFCCNRCPYSVTLWKVDKVEYKFKRKLKDSLASEDRVEMLERLVSKATSSYGLHQNHHLVVRAVEKWLSVVDLRLLLGSSPEIAELFKKIVNRARQLLEIRRIFRMVSERAKLKAILITAILRFKYKCAYSIPVVRNSDEGEIQKAKLEVILNHLRECAGPENSEVVTFVEDL